MTPKIRLKVSGLSTTPPPPLPSQGCKIHPVELGNSDSLSAEPVGFVFYFSQDKRVFQGTKGI